MPQVQGSPGKQTSGPWDPTVKPLKQSIGAAQKLFQSGQGFNPYMGQTVANFTGNTQKGLTGMMGVAKAGNPLLPGANAAIGGVMGNGGITSGGVYNGLLAQNGGVDAGAWSGLAGSGGIGTQGGYQGLLGQGGGISTMGQDQSLLGKVGNDAFSGALDTQAGHLTDDINREFSGLGRTGSAAQSGAIAQQVGDFRANALANQWQQNVANQRGIISDISQSQNQNMGNQLAGEAGLTNAQNANQQNMIAGTAGMTNAQNQNMGNQLSAAQGLTSAQNAAAGNQLAAAGMAPAMYQASLAPAQTMLQVGAAKQAQQQAKLAAKQARVTGQQQAPWQRLNAYQSALTGMGGGTQTTTPPSSPLGGAFGGGLLGYQAAGLPGAAIGGLLGYGANAFGL